MNTEVQVNSWILKNWTVFPKLNLIQNHESQISVKPRLMKLLEFFLLNQNEVVSKETILEYVWQDRIVTENLLTKSISELRQLLKKHFASDLEIETLRNAGYRFHTSFDIIPSTNDHPKLIHGKSPKKKGIYSASILLVLILLVTAAGFFRQKPITGYKYTLKRVSSLKGHELSPTISPNGENLAFAWGEPNKVPYQIYTKSIEGNIPRKLTRDSFTEFNPAWSPDGKFIAYFQSKKSGNLTLMKKSVIGDDEMELLSMDGWRIERGMLWTKDGKGLIFAGKKNKENPFALQAYFFQDNDISQLSFPPEGIYGDMYPAFSAHHNKIAFVRAKRNISILPNSQQNNFMVHLIDLDNLKIKLISSFEHEVKEIVYNPAMRNYLCWVSREFGFNTLYSIKENGHREKILQYNLGIPGSGDMTVDNVFYFEFWKSDLNVYVYPIVSSGQELLSQEEYFNSTQWDWNLQFATKSDKMAFISGRSGYQEIWMAQEGLPEKAQQITKLNGVVIRSLSISPDGKNILFVTKENNNHSLYHIQSNGEGLNRLSGDETNYTFPKWSVDGHYIYYSSNQTGTWNIWRRNLEGTFTEQLSQHGGYTLFPDPSKPDQLFFTKFKQDSLFQLSLNDRSEKFVCKLDGLEDENWIPYSKGIYFFAWKRSQCYLKHYDFSSQAISTLIKLDHILQGVPSIALSKDEKFIFITKADGLNSDILSFEFEE